MRVDEKYLDKQNNVRRFNRLMDSETLCQSRQSNDVVSDENVWEWRQNDKYD